MAELFGCVKNTIRLRGGGYFDFRNPQPEQFTLLDIAGALSKICRFGGHCDHFYSVAEHCVHCDGEAEKDRQSHEARRAILFHDATEAFVGDVVKPLKVMMPDYMDIERATEEAVAAKFGIDFETHREITKEFDQAMLIAERDYLFTRDEVVWHGENNIRKLDVPFRCWAPAQAEKRFILAAKRLGVMA